MTFSLTRVNPRITISATVFAAFIGVVFWAATEILKPIFCFGTCTESGTGKGIAITAAALFTVAVVSGILWGAFVLVEMVAARVPLLRWLLPGFLMAGIATWVTHLTIVRFTWGAGVNGFFGTLPAIPEGPAWICAAALGLTAVSATLAVRDL